MKQMELLESINKYLSRFQSQIKLSSTTNEYSINVHAENVLIPVLNLVYNLQLKNVNFSEEKNSEAIDLLDETQRVAFQVTSTKGIEKVKTTLKKFLNSKYKNKVDTLYFYILSEKQASYSQVSISGILGGKLDFDTKKHIIDASDIIRKLNELNDLKIIENVEHILHSQFSDIRLSQNFSLSDFDIFKENYKQSCISNFSRINFFGLSVNSNRPREIELYSLFVTPTFSATENDMFTERMRQALIHNPIETHQRKIEFAPHEFKIDEFKDRLTLQKTGFITQVMTIDVSTIHQFKAFHSSLVSTSEITFSDLFAKKRNIVVIGKPGAGKSSFIKYSICKILEKDTGVFSNQAIYDFIPFRIELHKYNRFKKASAGSFVEYLSILLNEEYQIVLQKEYLETIVKKFPTLVFFDGLDEIFDIQERVAVRNDIESFIKQYSSVRAIVTSRYESYEEVNLTERLFTKYEISDFDDSQVEEYVTKWYQIEESSEQTRSKEIKNCILQLKTVDPELKYNPLLLSLILLLYRNELDIPTSKLSIYESCTNTIVETRDVKEKKLDIKLKVSNIISVFASLAYWQFGSENTGGTVSYETVRNYIKDHLLKKGEFTDERSANTATSEFLDFAKTRSIYLENKFTHKTFLEYFTAYYIYSFYYNNWKKAQELNEIISSYIGLSTWSVVLELLICKIDSTQITYEVVDELIEKQIESNCLDSLIFFVQIIKYLKNVSPQKTRFIIGKSIEFCFKDGEQTKEGKIDYKEALFTHLTALANNDRFKDIIESSFSELLSKEGIDNDCLNAFAFEFAIVAGNTNLVKVLQENDLESNSDYIFILKYFPSLFEEGTYLDCLQKFISKYNIARTANLYNSHFNQKIFFGSDQFNWNLSFIANTSFNKRIFEAYLKLISAGVPQQTLLESAKLKSSILQLTSRDLMIAGNKNVNFKKFAKVLGQTYKNTPQLEVAKNEMFYDKFFVQKKGKKKR